MLNIKGAAGLAKRRVTAITNCYQTAVGKVSFINLSGTCEQQVYLNQASRTHIVIRIKTPNLKTLHSF